MKQQPLCKVCKRQTVTCKRDYACGDCWKAMPELDKKMLKSGRDSLSLRSSSGQSSMGLMGQGRQRRMAIAEHIGAAKRGESPSPYLLVSKAIVGKALGAKA